MAEFPMFPLWTDAYLADTSHLTMAEHGAYLLLLMAMWRTPDKGLPNDDARLARFARANPQQWARVRPAVMAFFDVDGDRITQGRLRDEASAAQDLSKRQSVKAKARWLKSKGSADAAAMPKAPSGNASPSPSPLPTEKPSGSSVGRPPRKRGSVAKTDIPADAVLSDSMREHAIVVRGLSLAEALAQFARFRDRAIAHGDRYADWNAAWRNWLVSPYFAPIVGASQANGRRQAHGAELDDQFDALKARLAVQRLE